MTEQYQRYSTSDFDIDPDAPEQVPDQYGMEWPPALAHHVCAFVDPTKYMSYSTRDFDVDPDATPGDIENGDAANTPRGEDESSQIASVRQVFSFGSGPKKRIGLSLGLAFAVLSGCVFPALAFVLSTTFQTLSTPSSEGFLDDVSLISFLFMGLGAFSFISMSAQSALLETAAGEMTYSLKTSWFDALLRQDIAYFDIKDVSGTSTVISTAGAKYKAGVGRKLGEGIQFFVTFIGGFVYAFYASWETSLILLAVVPVMSASVLFFVKMNQTQTKRANESYEEAGSVAYMAVSAIRTVFSLNAVQSMIDKYSRATERAYRAAASRVALLGLANGMVMGSMFGLRNVVLTLYGAYLLYRQVGADGCDPSGNLDMNPNGACDPDGSRIFGALIGITLGAAGLPQISVALEAFTKARVASQPALAAMKRKVGSDDEAAVGHNETLGNDRRPPMPLPKYVIDSSSQEGMKPSTIAGNIEFCNVSFSYPTRMENRIFDGFSLSVKAGQTVALVGESGCGKSSSVALIERFYDPTSGSITIDGNDLRILNVKWLRDQIGLVQQEPILFARSIRENIAYGDPEASFEQIEAAARHAYAHDFIMSFPRGYETHVGDEGAQLSGGQKQRIAIARAILKEPAILLLDEATSALDSESERVVTAALENLLETGGMTTIVIAHRLSTIKECDVIAVMDDGKIVESGRHDELLALKGRYHRLVEAQKLSKDTTSAASAGSTEGRAMNRNSYVATHEFERPEAPHLVLHDVYFSYPTRKQNMIFSGLNLAVRRGESLAIVGPTGCGKSTIVSLIERFYDPTSGTISLNGVDLRELNVRWLRDQIGLVQQEPTLFDTTIGENIRYGDLNATQKDIEEASRRAYAHEFITSFPDGYDTFVGARGTQLSGGQKQRVAIARAILKRPSILLLDEATSALDSESESSVQAALDESMKSKSQTTIVIAHRLSTLQNCDRIAVIADGKVRELGTHDELLAKPNGRYKRLSMFQSLDRGDSSNIKSLMDTAIKEQEMESRTEKKEKSNNLEETNSTGKVESERSGAEKSDIQRARRLAKDDTLFLVVGGIGAILAGLCFPASGVLLAYTIELLYRPLPGCDANGLPSCDSIANEMQETSFNISYGWLGILGSTLVGNVVLFHGFGTASERLNRRVRDSAFASLLTQEIAWFDKHSVGSITSQLQDDAAMIYSFSGEPIRTLVVSVASLLVGIVISFVFMWPFALLSICCTPFMAFSAKLRVKLFFGEDEGDESDIGKNSPSGIVVETLLNMRTVASLNIEETRSREYSEALRSENPTPIRSVLFNGALIGLGQLVQQWSMALMFFWGGWLLYTYPRIYSYRDFLISLFSLMMSISGMTFGTQGATDKEEAKAAAKRIFHLIDRRSAIDPLSDAGRKVEATDIDQS